MQTCSQFVLMFLVLINSRIVLCADDVRIERDVAYLGADRNEKLDLYMPAKVEKGQRFPAVVIIHGGGWTGGDKGHGREQNIGTNMARSGYVCASINYVLAKKSDEHFAARLATVWPQNLHDCKTAVRFLRMHADRYHIDSKHIGAIGGSAGGHLTAMLGLTGRDAGLDPKGPYGEFSCQVQAVVPMYGVHDFIFRARYKRVYDEMTDQQRALCIQASPVTHATNDDPPTLILHGTKDALVPVKQSELLQAAMKKAGASSQLVIIPDAPHTFHLQPKQRDLRPLVIGFFDKHLKKP